ncbi:MAG: transposase [Bacteroidetes bacterium]|nr:transposase [Bacteroidota bacterium]
MQKTEPFQHGKYYHIYNRGINNSKLFYEDENYNYFLKLYNTHVSPAVDTFAYCLMKNHFHLLIRIKEEDQILTQPIKPPHQYFSNLFNAYTKAINKKYDRNSSLFQRTFKRKVIDSEAYLKNVILYINTNPAHHKLAVNYINYKWSSYSESISDDFTNLQKDQVLEWFGDKENFKSSHENKLNTVDIENYLEL